MFNRSRWLLPCALIVSCQYAVALTIGAVAGFHYEIPFSAYFISAAIVSAVAVCALCTIRIVRGGELPAPIGLLDPVAAIMLVGLQMAVLAWLKIMMPLVLGFRADGLLANLDHILFFGDPSAHLRIIDFALPTIDRLYVTWAPVKFAALLAIALLSPSARRDQALISYFVIVATVAIGQYLLPSAGPVFWEMLGDGRRFAALPLEPWVVSARDYLWADYLRSGGHIGSGISAFPSLHVAIATWILLLVRTFAVRLQVLAWFWFSAIFVGSIALGWHYGLDSIAGVAIACVAWSLASQRFRGQSVVPQMIGEGPRLDVAGAVANEPSL